MEKVGDSAGFLSNSCPSWLLDLSLCCNRFSGAYTWIVYALRTRPSDFFISYRRTSKQILPSARTQWQSLRSTIHTAVQ